MQLLIPASGDACAVVSLTPTVVELCRRRGEAVLEERRKEDGLYDMRFVAYEADFYMIEDLLPLLSPAHVKAIEQDVPIANEITEEFDLSGIPKLNTQEPCRMWVQDVPYRNEFEVGWECASEAVDDLFATGGFKLYELEGFLAGSMA